MGNTTAAQFKVHSDADHRAALELADSWLAAVAPPITVGTEWVQLDGFVTGPQNFDITLGPDLLIGVDGDQVEVQSAGRYWVSVNCQLTNPTGDGWFEGAVEPNGLSLAEWPTDIAQGHAGRYIPAIAAGWDGVDLGAVVGYVAPRLLAGATVTAWARYGSATGDETIDVMPIMYVIRVTN